MSITKVSPKGQVVIPVEFRVKYNLQPGTTVQIIDVDKKIVILPGMNNPVKEAFGFLKGGSSLTEALIKLHEEENE